MQHRPHPARGSHMCMGSSSTHSAGVSIRTAHGPACALGAGVYVGSLCWRGGGGRGACDTAVARRGSFGGGGGGGHQAQAARRHLASAGVMGGSGDGGSGGGGSGGGGGGPKVQSWRRRCRRARSASAGTKRNDATARRPLRGCREGAWHGTERRAAAASVARDMAWHMARPAPGGSLSTEGDVVCRSRERRRPVPRGGTSHIARPG